MDRTVKRVHLDKLETVDHVVRLVQQASQELKDLVVSRAMLDLLERMDSLEQWETLDRLETQDVLVNKVSSAILEVKAHQGSQDRLVNRVCEVTKVSPVILVHQVLMDRRATLVRQGQLVSRDNLDHVARSDLREILAPQDRLDFQV